MPSVSLDNGKIFFISAIEMMTAGETAATAMNSTTASFGMVSTIISGKVMSAAKAVARSNWRGKASLGFSAPKARPAMSELAA